MEHVAPFNRPSANPRRHPWLSNVSRVASINLGCRVQNRFYRWVEVARVEVEVGGAIDASSNVYHDGGPFFHLAIGPFDPLPPPSKWGCSSSCSFHLVFLHSDRFTRVNITKTRGHDVTSALNQVCPGCAAGKRERERGRSVTKERVLKGKMLAINVSSNSIKIKNLFYKQ